MLRFGRILSLILVLCAAVAITGGEAAAACTAYVGCANGTGLRCSCAGAGTCSSNPNANPWGGSVYCNCVSEPDASKACKQPSCSQTICDNHCGGPGTGVCSGGFCYCM
jgi:hypothetical protein